MFWFFITIFIFEKLDTNNDELLFFIFISILIRIKLFTTPPEIISTHNKDFDISLALTWQLPHRLKANRFAWYWAAIASIDKQHIVDLKFARDLLFSEFQNTKMPFIWNDSEWMLVDDDDPYDKNSFVVVRKLRVNPVQLNAVWIWWT